MDEKNKSIASTFNTKIRTSWVWLVLAITVGLTILFYVSQKPQVIVYASFTKALSDYRLQEAHVMRLMDRVRVGFDVDTVAVQAQSMTLREMAVSYSREVDQLRNLGERAPSNETVNRFEKEVLGKVASLRRYAHRRTLWFESCAKLERIVGEQQDSRVRDGFREALHMARSGRIVVVGPEELQALPDSVRGPMANLFQENEELSMAWRSFDNDMAAAYSEDMARFFQQESLDEMSLKSRIPMAFYFLSLVLLLSTFFFALYARR